MTKHREGKRRYLKLRGAVSDAVNRADPIGLLALGAPSDEYDPEVGTVLPRLRDAASAEGLAVILHEEFIRWFGSEQAGILDLYRRPAAEIWDVLASSGAV